jgi:hypothetical protein
VHVTAARRDGLVLALILAVAAALRFVALLLHDARHDFSESHAIVDYLWHGTCRILPEAAGSWPAGLPVIA